MTHRAFKRSMRQAELYEWMAFDAWRQSEREWAEQKAEMRSA